MDINFVQMLISLLLQCSGWSPAIYLSALLIKSAEPQESDLFSYFVLMIWLCFENFPFVYSIFSGRVLYFPFSPFAAAYFIAWNFIHEDG